MQTFVTEECNSVLDDFQSVKVANGDILIRSTDGGDSFDVFDARGTNLGHFVSKDEPPRASDEVTSRLDSPSLDSPTHTDVSDGSNLSINHTSMISYFILLFQHFC